MFGFLRERDVQRDVIAVFVNFFAGVDAVNQPVDGPRAFNGQIRVAAVNIHAKAIGDVGDVGADCTEADDAQRFALQFRADKLRFAFFNGFGHAFGSGQRFCPSNAVADFTGRQQKRTDGQFFDRIGVGAGRVENGDACFAAAVNRNVVDADAGAADAKQLIIECHVQQVGGANQNAFRVFCVVRTDKLCRIQPVCSDRRNFIHELDFIFSVLHEETLLSYFV